jgi:peptide/nickel transport system substrate-binding protein
LNWGQFCDRHIDAEITQALSMQASNPGTAAVLWSKVDHDIVDRAPAVPFFSPQALELVSARVGNYTYSPFVGGALLDQLWVR